MHSNAKAIRQELLVVRCQLGETAAFDELVDQWHLPLWRYLRRMTDSIEVAEELLQETWLRALRGIVKLREPASLAPWLFGIARRVLMDQLREKYMQATWNEDVVDPQSTQSEVSDDREEIEHLLHKLGNLPLPQREVLTLYYLEQMSVRELAGILNIPEGTVKSRLHHARHLLKRNLTEVET
jgi:RNA polymerase sigma factor (sigma-70 family)